MRVALLIRSLAVPLYLLLGGAELAADAHVIVIARANPEYEQARRGTDGRLKPQSYVVMEGNYYAGHTVDRSIERMTFRQIAEYLAPELAKQEYLPGASPETADLLLLVHWGTTLPKVGVQEMTAHVTQEVDQNRLLAETLKEFDAGGEVDSNFGGLPEEMTLTEGHEDFMNSGFAQLQLDTDEMAFEKQKNDNVSLLGYGDDLHRLGQASMTSELERALRHDLINERYFIVIKAYELKDRTKSALANRPVWTMHLNISSPGNNFQTAITRMGAVAARFAGTTTVEPRSIRPRLTTGTVKLAPLVILGRAAAD